MAKNILLLLPVFLILSCSVQKRKYQKGYCFNWNYSGKTGQKKDKQETSSFDESSFSKKPSEPLKKTETSVLGKQNLSITQNQIKNVTAQDSCDVLIFKDGSEKRVKLIEITSTQIKYKNCNMPDGPDFINNKSEIFMITYTTGIKEVFKVEPAVEPVYKQPDNYSAYNQHKEKSKRRRTKMATSAFVLSLIGIYPLLFVTSIAAVILSTIQLSRIQTDPDHYGAERKAKAAQIIGIIGTGVGLLFTYFFITTL